MICHGCSGKGWVETAGGAMVHICPICKGTGWIADSIYTSTTSYSVPIQTKVTNLEKKDGS